MLSGGGAGLLTGGTPSGRMRHTGNNDASKNNGTIPGISQPPRGGGPAGYSLSSTPDSQAALYAQLEAAFNSYQTTLAQSRYARVGARADFGVARANANAQGIANMTGVQNHAIESGMLGGSADLKQRIGVRASVASDIQAAANARDKTIAASRFDAMSAGSTYEMNVAQAQSTALAQQQAQAAADMQNNLIQGGQEAQMDMMKQFYNQMATMYGFPPLGGGGKPPKKGGGGPVGTPSGPIINYPGWT